MSVRFIVGRAGTGKTHHCLQEIRRHLAQDPVDGPRLIFLVPEQASLQMERAIVDAPCRENIAISEPSSRPCPPKATGDMVHAAHRAEVLSFQRLAFRVFEFTGAPLREAISESARAMVLRRLMTQEAPRLKFYRRADRMGGVVEQLAGSIVEFIQESVTPDALDEIAGDGQSLDPMQAAKFHDLSILYRAYLEYLGNRRLDPTQYLQVARERFPRCDWLNGALLWVDGFASMSAEETTTLVALSGMCSRVEMTVLMDAALADEKVFLREPFAASRRHPTASTQRLFARTAQTFDDLQACITAAGIAEDPPLVLQDAAPPRFARSPRIAGIEANLFDPGAADARPGGDRPAPTFEPSRLPSEPNEVELFALPSCRLEVEHAVAKVCEWVRSTDRTLRYRDIAIIARDLEPYHDLLSNALIARDVPFFIDRRRPLAHHPLVEWLRGLVAVAADDYSLASVRILLKTGLLPLSDDEADELENYLLAFGIAGASTWRKKDWSYVRRGSWRASRDADEPSPASAAELVRKSRDAVVRVLDPWVRFAAASTRHLGEQWRDAINESFDLAGVAGALERWADQAEELGDLDGAEEHRQAWRTIVEFLDDLGSAFADAALTVAELSEVLDTGLATLTLGLVPPMVDQVLVGSIERSRHPDIKAAVLVGFNDGVFPMRLAEDPILNDDDREWLRVRGLRIAPPTRDRSLDESLLVYIALTRASERLAITYSMSDAEGRELGPSSYVEALRQACPDLTVGRIDESSASRSAGDVCVAKDLRRRLFSEFRNRPALNVDDQSRRSLWNGVYEWVRAALTRDVLALRIAASLRDRIEETLSATTIQELHRGTLRTSVTRMESFARCPFQHFARFVLRLAPRAEAVAEPLDVGQIHHAILEDFTAGVARDRIAFGDLDDATLLARLSVSCGRVADMASRDVVLSEARSAYLLRRSGATLGRLLRAQRNVARAGRAKPWRTELSFGMDEDDGMAPLDLLTPNGRNVLLRGYIDRVDLIELADRYLGVVVDYKRTRDRNRHVDLSEVYHGVTLQLPAYLLALQARGETLAGRPIEPIAGLYVVTEGSYAVVDHPSAQPDGDGTTSTMPQPKGILQAEHLDKLDEIRDGRSTHYRAFRKKDGTFGYLDATDVATAREFAATLTHTKRRLGELADGVIDGNVRVNPCRLERLNPCTWCAMADVCRFEIGVCEVRFLGGFSSRSEVLQRMVQQAS